MSETAIRQAATPSINRETVGAMAIALVVFAVGYRIPLPGLDVATLVPQLQGWANASAMARVSILALGVMPLFTVLTLLEMLRLFIPPLARWQAGKGAGWVAAIVALPALALAGLQGAGILAALSDTGLVRPDASATFLPVGIACFIGATALLIWLARSIRLPGIGSGFWLLLAVPFLGSIPREIAMWFTYLREGAATPLHVVMVVAYLVGTVAVVVFLRQALRRQFGDGDGDMTVPAILLIWPPLLAGVLGGILMSLALLLAGSTPEILPSLQIIGLVATIVLVPVFLWVYARRLVPGGIDVRRQGKVVTPVLTMLAAAHIAILVLGEVLQTLSPLPFSLGGTMLIVLTLVLMAPFTPVRPSASVPTP